MAPCRKAPNTSRKLPTAANEVDTINLAREFPSKQKNARICLAAPMEDCRHFFDRLECIVRLVSWTLKWFRRIAGSESRIRVQTDGALSHVKLELVRLGRHTLSWSNLQQSGPVSCSSLRASGRERRCLGFCWPYSGNRPVLFQSVYSQGLLVALEVCVIPTHEAITDSMLLWA